MATKKMKIVVDVDTGWVESVTDENGNVISPLSQPATPPVGGFREIGNLRWSKTNPTCITLNIIGGGQYQVCF